MIFGYARVSTEHQSLEIQRKSLFDAGCERIFAETQSGARTDRPELLKMMGMLREGDVVVVWALDRLGRSVIDLLKIIYDIGEKRAAFRCLSQPVDTTTPAGRMLLQILASFAEFERSMIRERSARGLAAMRANGKRPGPKEKFSREQAAHAIDLLTANPKLRYSDVARMLGTTRSTLLRKIRAVEPTLPPDAAPFRKRPPAPTTLPPPPSPAEDDDDIGLIFDLT